MPRFPLKLVVIVEICQMVAGKCMAESILVPSLCVAVPSGTASHLFPMVEPTFGANRGVFAVCFHSCQELHQRGPDTDSPCTAGFAVPRRDVDVSVLKVYLLPRQPFYFVGANAAVEHHADGRQTAAVAVSCR